MISSRIAKVFWIFPVLAVIVYAIRFSDTSKPQTVETTASRPTETQPIEGTKLSDKPNEEAAIESLSTEIAALEQRLEKRERVLAQRKKEMQYTESASIGRSGLTPEQWTNKGYGSPYESVETLIYSAASGDLETMKSSLVYSPECEALAKSLFEKLPHSIREEQGSFESIMALMTIDQVPLAKARAHAFREITEEAREVFMVFTSNLESPKSVKLDFIQLPDESWRVLVPPQAVQAYADKLGIEF